MTRRAGSGSSTGGVSVDGSVASDRTLLENERGARAELSSALDDLLDAEVDAGLRPGVRRIWWVLVGLVVIGAVVAAGVGVAAWVRAAHAYTDDDYRETATEVTSLLLSADPADPARARRILDRATGGFHDEFAQSASSYTEYVRRTGTVGDATVDASGVSARSGDDATVLVAAAVSYRGQQQTPVREFRLTMLVVPDDGALKVSAVKYLP